MFAQEFMDNYKKKLEEDPVLKDDPGFQEYACSLGGRFIFEHDPKTGEGREKIYEDFTEQSKSDFQLSAARIRDENGDDPEAMLPPLQDLQSKHVAALAIFLDSMEEEAKPKHARQPEEKPPLPPISFFLGGK